MTIGVIGGGIGGGVGGLTCAMPLARDEPSPGPAREELPAPSAG